MTASENTRININSISKNLTDGNGLEVHHTCYPDVGTSQSPSPGLKIGDVATPVGVVRPAHISISSTSSSNTNGSVLSLDRNAPIPQERFHEDEKRQQSCQAAAPSPRLATTITINRPIRCPKAALITSNLSGSPTQQEEAEKAEDRISNSNAPDDGVNSSVIHGGRVRVLCRFRGKPMNTDNRVGTFYDGDSPVCWGPNGQSNSGGWLDFEGNGDGQGDAVSIRMGSSWSRRGFDKVFTPSVGQAEVFEQVRHVAHGVAQGFNGTLFAYGQTGSGKTYTMGGATATLSFTPCSSPRPPNAAKNGPNCTGTPTQTVLETPPPVVSPSTMTTPPPLSLSLPLPPQPAEKTVPATVGADGNNSEPGVGLEFSEVACLGSEAGLIPRAVSTMLADAHLRRKLGWEFVLTATYVEIYNEKIRDLLNPASDNLKVIEHPGRGVEVAGAREVRVSTLEEAVAVLRDGAKHRITAATLMNQASSRSHSIFMLRLDQRDVVRDCKVSARLTLVDLAGSERAGKTGVEGRRLEEANNINLSLHTLGRVIRTLSENAPHVPFRDSKLTRLLQESLGGNSRTVLIICCSPEEAQAQETLSTLKFGECAKHVTTFVSANVVASPDEVAAQLSELRAEVVRLKRQLHDFRLRETRRNGAIASSKRRLKRSSLAPGARVPVSSSGVSNRNWGASPFSRAASFNASFPVGESAASSGDDSWVDSSTRGVWEQEDIPRCSIGDGAVNALSTPTPFRKSMVLGSLSPVLMAVSPTVVSPNATIYSNSPKGILGGRRGTGNWDVTPPTPRPSPVKARKQNKKWNNLGGGGAASFSRRLRRESGGDEDQQRDGEVAESVAVLLLPGGSTAAPSQHKTSPSSSRKATVGVPRSGSSLPMEKVTPAASGSDGVRYRWARRNSSGKGWKWELDLRKSPTRRKVQTPVAKPITSDMRATATAAAKAGAAKAAKAAASALAKKKVASETVAKQVVVKQAVCISPAVTQNKNTEILELCCPGRNLVEGDEQEQGRLQRAGPTKSGEPSTGGLSEAVATAGLATMTVEKEELAEECCDAAAGGVEGPTLTLPSREGRGEEERVLRAALARINNLENGWMDGVKAYEELLHLKDLRIESLMSAYRHRYLLGSPNNNHDPNHEDPANKTSSTGDTTTTSTSTPPITTASLPPPPPPLNT